MMMQTSPASDPESKDPSERHREMARSPNWWGSIPSVGIRACVTAFLHSSSPPQNLSWQLMTSVDPASSQTVNSKSTESSPALLTEAPGPEVAQ